MKKMTDDYFFPNFENFLKSLSILPLSANQQITAMNADNLGVKIRLAFEIQSDVLENGIIVLKDEYAKYLFKKEKLAISVVLNLLENLPEDALRRDPNEALNHVSWEDVRASARICITELKEATTRYKDLLFLPHDWAEHFN